MVLVVSLPGGVFLALARGIASQTHHECSTAETRSCNVAHCTNARPMPSRCAGLTGTEGEGNADGDGCGDGDGDGELDGDGDGAELPVMDLLFLWATAATTVGTDRALIVFSLTPFCYHRWHMRWHHSPHPLFAATHYVCAPIAPPFAAVHNWCGVGPTSPCASQQPSTGTLWHPVPGLLEVVAMSPKTSPPGPGRTGGSQGHQLLRGAREGPYSNGIPHGGWGRHFATDTCPRVCVELFCRRGALIEECSQ